MRFAGPLAFIALLGALFPGAASAAAPGAVGGSGFVTALVIAGAGALVIMLIMVAVPAARRGGGSAASGPSVSSSPSSTVTPFRAHPMTSPTTDESEPAGAQDQPATTPQTPTTDESEPTGAQDQPATTHTTPTTDESEPTGAQDQPISTPQTPTTDESEPTGAQGDPRIEETEQDAREPVAEAPLARPAVPHPLPSERFSVPGRGAVEEEHSAISDAEAGPQVATIARPAPASAAESTPDLLSALSPAAVLGESFDTERTRESMASAADTGAIAPELGARALLRDHSLAVPIAACVLVGVTLHFARARRRRH